MAFIQNQADDGGENQNQLMSGQQPQGQPMQAEPPAIPTMGMAQAGPSPAPAQPSIGQTPQQQAQRGSGRFTNLQKYVQANQGAGQRLASGVNKQIERTLNPVKKEATTQEQRTAQGIQQGQQTLTQGQGLQQQMAAPDFTPQRAVEFANQAGNVERVGQFRTGQAVDERALEQQRQAFQQATANLGQKVDERGQQVGSEIGRINLLKEAFGGRNRDQYTTGQSRLDNLLLQSGPSNLQALNQNIEANRQNINQLQAKAAAQGKSIQQVIADEAALAKSVQDTTTANIDRFKTGLGGQVEQFNKDIEAGLLSGNQFIDFYNQTISDQAFKDKYGVSKKDYQFNRDLFQDFGLKRGQQTFNVFNNRDLNLGQVAEIEGRRAQDWRDVATGQNVTEYDALARLRGLTQPEFELTQASDINRAGFKKYEDERGLQNRINKAREDFVKNAERQLIEGATGFVEGVKGTGAISLADYLRNPDYYNRAQVRFERDDGSAYGGDFSGLAQFGALTNQAALATLAPQLLAGGGNLSDISGMASNVNRAYQSATGPLGQLVAPTQILSDISRNLFGGGGGQDYGKGESYVTGRTIGGGYTGDESEQGFLGAATGQALQNFLASQGFGNYLTEGGVKQSGATAQDLARQFGYRTTQRDNMTQEGFYNPMFERERFMQSLGLPTGQQGQASTQITDRSGPMTAEQALANRPTGETPQQRATREQIAAATTTSSDAERAALRQELIGANRYLTSDPEYQEILNRATSSAGQNLQNTIQNDLINQYMSSGDPTARSVRENFGYGYSGLPGMANAYFRENNPNINTSALNQSYQNMVNQALQGQVYGREISPVSAVNSQDILNRVLQGNTRYSDVSQQFYNDLSNRNRGYVPIGF